MRATVEMLFYKRAIERAHEDARDRVQNGVPEDDAILARDWIARPTPDVKLEKLDYFKSFAFACEVLNRDVAKERRRLLVEIDDAANHHSPQVEERLCRLYGAEESVPEFAAPRIVAEIDQRRMFGPQAEEELLKGPKNPRKPYTRRDLNAVVEPKVKPAVMKQAQPVMALPAETMSFFGGEA